MLDCLVNLPSQYLGTCLARSVSENPSGSRALPIDPGFVGQLAPTLVSDTFSRTVLPVVVDANESRIAVSHESDRYYDVELSNAPTKKRMT